VAPHTASAVTRQPRSSTPAQLSNNSWTPLLHISHHRLLEEKQKGTSGLSLQLCSSLSSWSLIMSCHLRQALLSSPVSPCFSHTAPRFPSWRRPRNICHLCTSDAWRLRLFQVVCFNPGKFVSWAYSAITLVSCCWVQLYPEISPQPKH